MSEKTCYTYKQVKVPVKAHELAQEIAKQKGERLADTWINSLQDYNKNSKRFTGRTDKNGVKIYEGDKLSQRGDLSNPLIVEWSDINCMFEAVFINGSSFADRSRFSLSSQIDEHSEAELIQEKIDHEHN